MHIIRHTCYTKYGSAHNGEEVVFSLLVASTLYPSSRKSKCVVLAGHTHLVSEWEGI